MPGLDQFAHVQEELRKLEQLVEQMKQHMQETSAFKYRTVRSLDRSWGALEIGRYWLQQARDSLLAQETPP